MYLCGVAEYTFELSEEEITAISSVALAPHFKR
jgi:hypothetical protein